MAYLSTVSFSSRALSKVDFASCMYTIYVPWEYKNARKAEKLKAEEATKDKCA